MKKVEIVDLMDFCTEEMADQGVDIDIFDPKGNFTGIVVNMKGTDSAAYLEEDTAIKRFNLSQGKKQQDFTAGMDPDEIKKANLRRLKVCFNNWKQVIGEEDDGTRVYKDTIYIDKKELPSTKGQFGELMGRRGFFWFRRQVEEGMDKVTNFLPPPKTISSPQQNSASSTTAPTTME